MTLFVLVNITYSTSNLSSSSSALHKYPYINVVVVVSSGNVIIIFQVMVGFALQRRIPDSGITVSVPEPGYVS